jgi:hypothetical protein
MALTKLLPGEYRPPQRHSASVFAHQRDQLLGFETPTKKRGEISWWVVHMKSEGAGDIKFRFGNEGAKEEAIEVDGSAKEGIGNEQFRHQ